MRRAAFNFPAKVSVLLATATGAAVISDASPGRMTSLSDEIKAAFVGLSRSAYTVFTIASTVIDYKHSLHGLIKDSDEYRHAISEVQYPGLEKLMKLDITTMSIVSEFVSLLFPEYRFEWILSAFKDTISVELDFIQEARNSERTADNLRHKENVKIPRVFWDITTKEVLSMEFCPGFKVDDLEVLHKWGIDPRKVAKALVEVFSEMIFVHGFVHGDPHPGNILVSPSGGKGFTLVLLDHGMYKELDEGFRRDYCRLWKALVLRDANEIHYIGESFGVGRYAKYLPLIFTGKPIDSTSGLGKGMSVEEKNIVKQQLKGLAMEDISSFMESLPADFLIVLRTDGILRSILNKLDVSRSVRLLTYAKHAVYGLSVTHDSQSDSMLDALLLRIRSKLSYLQFKCILGILGLLSWMDDIKYLSSTSLRSLLAAARRLGFSQLSSQ